MLLLLAALSGCAGGGAVPRSGQADGRQELEASAPILGDLVRAGQVCGIAVSTAALDRAARIEAAVIELHRRQGGTAARDDFLRSMAPPSFDPRQGGADRAAWCAARQAEIARADGFLTGRSGDALLLRAEATLASLH
ncbi:hypothetical protein QWZ14_00180 [Paeniroseomonas aquatica]|uniref:DUF1311 domain-containing protein n=1 Tax=Paeniroseomonas aquatica TaxID=373043 RepID=A0ABT7ZZB1_9PROT|nr:hypothetical protein [Paeniroseomonas aquatica]MDN3562806.1 hypothetical protein [Paeniroseomonas aquatica]